MNKKAFTLSELLIVVLIIGVLVGIVLPRYKLTIERTKAAQVLSLVASFSDAEDRFYTTHGDYTYNYTDLDLELPSKKLQLAVVKKPKPVMI